MGCLDSSRTPTTVHQQVLEALLEVALDLTHCCRSPVDFTDSHLRFHGDEQGQLVDSEKQAQHLRLHLSDRNYPPHALRLLLQLRTESQIQSVGHA